MHSRSTDAPKSDPHQGLDRLLEAAGDIVFRTDAAGMVRFASSGALAVAAPRPLPPGSALTALVLEADQPAVRNALVDAATTADPVRVEARLKSSSGDTWFELRICRCGGADDPAPLLVVGRDMSVQHATEERLRHMATHDGLTELPNRLLLSDRIRMVIATARRSGQAFAVATVGLDGFKKVNDALGHPVGDAVLRMAALRLRRALRDSDTLARVGGD
jgi:predicted signal transduction protein with EAL and GGDEF domain